MALPGKKEIKVTASDALEFEPVVHPPTPRGWGLKVLVLLVLAGGGAGAWLFYGDQLERIWASSEPGIPLVKAAPGPVKVRPENPGGLRVPDRDKLVYDRIQGKTAERTEGDGPFPDRGPERLLPPPEEPLPKPSASAKPAKAEPLKKDAAPSEPARPEKLVGKAKVQPKPQAKAKPVAKVPTIKDVKTAKRPAPPPPPPAPPAAPKSKSPILAAAKRLSKPEAETPAPEPAPLKGKQTPTAKIQPPEPKPPTPAPTPTVRPAQAPPPVPAAPKKTAAKAPDPQPKPQPIPKSRAYLVQLAAARSPQGARTEWARLRSKHLDLLGDLGLTVTKADLGPARGIYYRLRAGPISDEAKARQLCKRLAERQVGCLIIKPEK